MSSKGESETDQLKRNLEEQLERLLQELSDLEECKDELEASEYEAARADTEEQLRELRAALSKHQPQLTPSTCPKGEGQRQRLRQRLDTVQRDLQLGHVSPSTAHTLKVKCELLVALRQLGERLTADQLREIAPASPALPLPTTFTPHHTTGVAEQSAMELMAAHALAHSHS